MLLLSNCVKDVKSNFSAMHKNQIHCPLVCNSENTQIDTQDHLLSCEVLNTENPSKFHLWFVNLDIFQQAAICKIIAGPKRGRPRWGFPDFVRPYVRTSVRPSVRPSLRSNFGPYTFIKLRFILPCKSDCQPIYQN